MCPSQIDPTLPVTGQPTTASVRANFQTAHDEIGVLQNQATGSPFLPLSGGRMTGQMWLAGDPTDAMMPATKGYVDAGGGAGGGGIPEAPADHTVYGRVDGAWHRVLRIEGDTLLGPLVLAADPTNVLGAVTKQYADAINAKIMADAPNDANTYGRHANAWAGVLPITGGQLTGAAVFLGVGRAQPTPAPFLPLVLASMATADEFDLNAYQSASGAWSRIVAGTAARITRDATGNFTIGVAPTGAAGSAVTFVNALTIGTQIGSAWLAGSPAIPTDAYVPFLGVSSIAAALGGAYAFNSYIPTPGSTWRYLAAGFAAQLFLNPSGGAFTITLDASGASGANVTVGPQFLFGQNGRFTAVNGGVFGANFVMATASAGSAFVGSWQTGGTSSALGFWNANNILYFGNSDANGVPTASCANLTAAGTLTVSQTLIAGSDVQAAGGLWGGGASRTLGIGGGGTGIIQQYASTWYWDWTSSNGDLRWIRASVLFWGFRVSDGLAFNNIGPVAGVGAYQVLSDERAKQDIEPAGVGLDEILRLEPISFIRIPPEGQDNAPLPELGFSAQQVARVIPKAVRIMGIPLPDGTGGIDDDDPTLGVTDTPIVAALVNAVKTLTARIAALETT